MADTDDANAIDRQPGSTQMLPDRAMMVRDPAGNPNTSRRWVLRVSSRNEEKIDALPIIDDE